MCIHSQEEGDEQVVGIPERLERLLANSMMGSGVHQQHAEEHDVAGDTTGLSVVDLYGKDRSNLGSLNIEEAISC